MNLEERAIREKMAEYREKAEVLIGKSIILTEQDKLDFLYYAEQDKLMALKFVSELSLVNPDKTFEELLNCYSPYWDAMWFITRFKPEEKKSFPDCLIFEKKDEALALSEKIKTILPKGKPKDAAAVYWVLYKAGKISINKHTTAWQSMTEYFGNIGSRAGFSKFFRYMPAGLMCEIEDNFIEHCKKKILA